MRVALSVGHGQKRSGEQVVNDPGAVHESLGVTEYDTCRRIHRCLMPMLEEYPGIEVVPVPVGIPLQDRVKFIVGERESMGLDLAVELHMNGAVPEAHGTESLHYPGSELGIRWAERLNSWMVEVLGTRDRGIKEGYYRLDESNLVDWFLRAPGTPPAVIVEPEFITNAAVAGWVINGDFIQHVAFAIFCALTERD